MSFIYYDIFMNGGSTMDAGMILNASYLYLGLKYKHRYGHKLGQWLWLSW